MVYGCDLSVLILRGLVDRDSWWRHSHCLNSFAVRVSGQCAYAVLLADTESTAVGEKKLVKERKTKAQDVPGLFGPLVYLVVHSILDARRT
jgi:hypothetical protein